MGASDEPRDNARDDKRDNSNILRVICGPTAAGKSAIAMMLAERYGAMLISADSRQIYRGFDIGTGKPGAEEMRRVAHRGVDVVGPDQHYSAFQWATDALAWLAEAAGDCHSAVVVGGTGFYIRSLVDPPFDEKLCSPALRATYLLVDPGVALARHIECRIASMLAAGWLDEVARLRDSVPADAIAWKACGYRNLRDYFDGFVTVAQARERILIATRQYAKRQRTWFRHQLPHSAVTHLDPHDPRAAQLATDWWERSA